jgi:hypothetical protein
LVKILNTLEQYVSIVGFATADTDGGQIGNGTEFSPRTLVFPLVSFHTHAILCHQYYMILATNSSIKPLASKDDYRGFWKSKVWIRAIWSLGIQLLQDKQLFRKIN